LSRRVNMKAKKATTDNRSPCLMKARRVKGILGAIARGSRAASRC
jgi:hypothetical protein